MIISGTTDEFKQYNRNTVYVDVDFSQFTFERLPYIEDTLHCTGSCQDLIGIDSIYNLSEEGFRVYITRTTPNFELSLEEVNNNKWVLVWKALSMDLE